MRRIGLVAVLAGCGLAEEDFAAEAIRLTCEQADACGEIALMGGSVEACVESLSESTPLPSETPGCAYDRGAAADCLDELEAQACDAAAPASCDAVCG